MWKDEAARRKCRTKGWCRPMYGELQVQKMCVPGIVAAVEVMKWVISSAWSRFIGAGLTSTSTGGSGVAVVFESDDGVPREKESVNRVKRMLSEQHHNLIEKQRLPSQIFRGLPRPRRVTGAEPFPEQTLPGARSQARPKLMQLLHGFSSSHCGCQQMMCWSTQSQRRPTLTLRRLQLLQPLRDFRCGRMDFLVNDDTDDMDGT